MMNVTDFVSRLATRTEVDNEAEKVNLAVAFSD